MSSSFRIRRKRHKFTKAEALRLSGGKYWIMGREVDEKVLVDLGVELGPKVVDDQGRIKRAKGMVVWGQCDITDLPGLKPYWKVRFIWGPDCPDNVMKDRVRARVDYGTMKGTPHTVAEANWSDPEFRKEVGADVEPT